MSSQRDDKLRQNQQIQRYFDDYRELMAWASEVMAKITSPDLAQDIAGAETLMSRLVVVVAVVVVVSSSSSSGGSSSTCSSSGGSIGVSR